MNDSFLTSKVTERENELIKQLSTLKHSPYKVVLYGAGNMAHRIKMFSEKSGLFKIDTIAVDRQYLKPETSFMGHNVADIDSISSSSNTYNYIIGAAAVRSDRLNALRRTAHSIIHLDATCLSLSGEEIGMYRFYVKHLNEFENLYALLSDQVSKNTLSAFINQRISAKMNYCSKVYCPNQYFPDNIVALTEGETFVDCGAYDGDTILSFLRELERCGISKRGTIYAFEPNKTNYDKLYNVAKNIENIKIFNKGVFNGKDLLCFNEDFGIGSFVSSDGSSTIEVDMLDSILKGDRVSFIKMDVEGAELEALHGASETIRKYKPALAISIYHKLDDPISIPAYIKDLVPAYKFYIRQHDPVIASELVLYALL